MQARRRERERRQQRDWREEESGAGRERVRRRRRKEGIEGSTRRRNLFRNMAAASDLRRRRPIGIWGSSSSPANFGDGRYEGGGGGSLNS